MESKNKNEQLLEEANRREEQHLRELKLLRQLAERQEQHLQDISQKVGCFFWYFFGPTIAIVGIIVLLAIGWRL